MSIKSEHEFVVLRIRDSDYKILRKFIKVVERNGKTGHDCFLELQNYVKILPVKPASARKPIHIGIPKSILALLRKRGTTATPWVHLLFDAMRKYLEENGEAAK